MIVQSDGRFLDTLKYNTGTKKINLNLKQNSPVGQCIENNQMAAEKRPECVDKLSRQDKGAKKVNIVHKQLAHMFKMNNGQPIPYYKLVIDPKNFMNTVENAFQIAFLVHDNRIAIETGDDNYPHVRLIRSDEVNAVKETTQAICTLNLEKCREMILFYEIAEPMLIIENSEDE